MANSKFVTVLLLLFLSLDAGKNGKGEVVEEVIEEEETIIEVDLDEQMNPNQYLSMIDPEVFLDKEKEDKNLILTRGQLVVLNYNTICQQKYMVNFNRLVFVKAYVNYEENPHVFLDKLNQKQINILTSYRESVRQFLNHIDEELATLNQLPPWYLEIKFHTLLKRAYEDLGTPEEVQDMLQSILNEPGIGPSLENLKTNLKVQPLTHDYLKDAKSQLVAQRKNPKFHPSTDNFVDKLPITLSKILHFVRQNPSTPTRDNEYLINFFNVFGKIIPKKKYYDLILKFFTHHLDSQPEFQDSSHPLILTNKDLYNVPGLNDYPQAKILKIDRTFHNTDKELDQVHDILKVHEPTYTYHPNWLNFFKYEKRDIPLTGTPEDKAEIAKEGFKNIYYVYAHLRHQNLIPPEYDNEPTKIPDLLYDFILDTPCYKTKESPCNLANLIPTQTFSRNYIVMLTLLKPFTSRAGEFQKNDIEKMAEKSYELGVADAEKNISNLKIDVKEFQNIADTKKIGLVEDQYKVNKSNNKKTKAEGPEPRKPLRKTDLKKSEMPEFRQTFDKNFQDIADTKPSSPDKLDKFVNALEVLLNKVEENDSDFSYLLTTLVGEKILSLENNIEDLSEEDTGRLFTTHKRTFDWTVKRIIDKFRINESNPFFKYLSYSIAQKKLQTANSLEPSGFRNEIHREIRQRDIYLFYYRVKLNSIEKSQDSTTIEELAKFIKDNEKIDVDEMESDFYFLTYQSSFEYMTHFMDLFRYFESEHSNVKAELSEKDGDKKSDQNSGTRFVHIFDRLYKFLIDIRFENNFDVEKPLKFAYERLLFCLDSYSNHIIDDASLPESNLDGYEPQEGLEEEEIENDKNNYLKNVAPCKQTYSNMSTYYFFLMLEAHSKHEEVLPLHQNFLKTHIVVRTDEFYEYLNFSTTDMANRFSDFCTFSGDYTCLGEELYKNFKTYLIDAKDGGLSVDDFLREKVFMSKSMTGDEASLSAAIVWDVMSGVSRFLNNGVKNYDSFRKIMTIKDLTVQAQSGAREQTILGLPIENKQDLAKYLALKYHRKFDNSDMDLKIASGVDHLLENTSDLTRELSNIECDSIPTLKFLLVFSRKFSHVQKVTRTLIGLDDFTSFFLWTTEKPKISPDSIFNILSGSTDKDISSRIKHYFKFKSTVPASKAKKTNAVAAWNKKNKGVLEKKSASQEVIIETASISYVTAEIESSIALEDKNKKDLKNALTKAGETITIINPGESLAQTLGINAAVVNLIKKDRLVRLRLLRRVLV